MTWYQCYMANFGKTLSPEEVASWEDEFKARIHNLATGEVLAAVRYLAEQVRKGEGHTGKYAPTINHIISAIIKRRGDARAEANGWAPRQDQDAAGRRGAIRNAKSLNDIWRAIYDAKDESETKDLVALAGELYGDLFCKPLLPTHEQCAQHASATGMDIVASHAEVWRQLNGAAEERFAGA